MEGERSVRSTFTICVLIIVLPLTAAAGAELKPGDVLNQSTWQEAKGMMPDAVLRRFEGGQHISKIIEIPPEALRWSTRYNEATEANQGTYEINAQGIMIVWMMSQRSSTSCGERATLAPSFSSARSGSGRMS